MEILYSADGTPIAYERRGSGPAVVLVGGAFSDHTATAALADLLAETFTTYCFDRRGRGASGDALPHLAEREVEDVAALVAHAGGAAALFGHSSGAVLALRTAAQTAGVTRVAVYEPSYVVGTGRPRPPDDLGERLSELVAAGRRADAVRLFLTECPRLSVDAVDAMRTTPAWPRLESFAHALDYDVALHGPGQSMQADVLGRIGVPTLVVAGSGALDWVLDTARAVAAAVPGAGHRVLDGEDHGVLTRPAALAPVLLEFFRAGRLTPRPGPGPSPRRPGP